jgi:hypothetical protein
VYPDPTPIFPLFLLNRKLEISKGEGTISLDELSLTILERSAVKILPAIKSTRGTGNFCGR